MLPVVECMCGGRVKPFGHTLWSCGDCGAYYTQVPRLRCVQAGKGDKVAEDFCEPKIMWVGPETQEYQDEMKSLSAAGFLQGLGM